MAARPLAPALILALPLLALGARLAGAGRRGLAAALSRLHAHAVAGRQAVAPVRDHLRADGLRRRAVRAGPEEPGRGAVRLCLRRLGHRRGARRRPRHGVRLLGADGRGLDAGALEQRQPRVLPRKPALPDGSPARRHVPARRRHRAHRADRQRGLRSHGARFARALADARSASWSTPAHRRCRPGCRMPIRKPRGAGRCSSRPSRPRRRSTC